MITAKQAQQLVEESESEKDRIVNDWCGKIEKLARDGKRELTLHIDSTEMLYQRDLPALPPATTNALKKMSELGYKVKYSTYGDSYVPAGLADDDGRGPSHLNYGIIIRW